MSTAMELKLNRLNTAAFIGLNPTLITLTPQRKQRTTTGGYKIANDPPREPQNFRIIDSTTSYGNVDLPMQRTIDGIERTVEFVLLGTYDAAFEQYDIWTDADGNRWELTQVFPDNGYERRALVVRHG